MTTTQININSSTYRADYRPAPRICEICLQAPAVRRVWHTDYRDGTSYTANCCDYCAGRAAKWR